MFVEEFFSPTRFTKTTKCKLVSEHAGFLGDGSF